MDAAAAAPPVKTKGGKLRSPTVRRLQASLKAASRKLAKLPKTAPTTLQVLPQAHNGGTDDNDADDAVEEGSARARPSVEPSTALVSSTGAAAGRARYTHDDNDAAGAVASTAAVVPAPAMAMAGEPAHKRRKRSAGGAAAASGNAGGGDASANADVEKVADEAAGTPAANAGQGRKRKLRLAAAPQETSAEAVDAEEAYVDAGGANDATSGISVEGVPATPMCRNKAKALAQPAGDAPSTPCEVPSEAAIAGDAGGGQQLEAGSNDMEGPSEVDTAREAGTDETSAHTAPRAGGVSTTACTELDSAAESASVVDVFKRRQRGSPEFRKAWVAYVNKRAEEDGVKGYMDPSRHNNDFLNAALVALDATIQEGLVAKVKAGQRNQAFRTAWEKYVEDRHRADVEAQKARLKADAAAVVVKLKKKNDPSKHDATYLEAALIAIKANLLAKDKARDERRQRRAERVAVVDGGQGRARGVLIDVGGEAGAGAGADAAPMVMRAQCCLVGDSENEAEEEEEGVVEDTVAEEDANATAGADADTWTPAPLYVHGEVVGRRRCLVLPDPMRPARLAYLDWLYRGGEVEEAAAEAWEDTPAEDPAPTAEEEAGDAATPPAAAPHTILLDNLPLACLTTDVGVELIHLLSSHGTLIDCNLAPSAAVPGAAQGTAIYTSAAAVAKAAQMDGKSFHGKTLRAVVNTPTPDEE